MARDLSRGGRAGELELLHWEAPEISQAFPNANPWRVERANLRDPRGAQCEAYANEGISAEGIGWFMG